MSTGTGGLIASVLSRYFPGWTPPRDTGREWVPCLCPAHEEDRPSCAVSYRHDAVKCLACEFSGDAISIIRRREGVSYAQAVALAATFSDGRSGPVSPKPRRKSRRRVFSG